MAELDKQPEMWPILGVSARDVRLPLQDIVSTHGRDDPSRRHPVFLSTLYRVNDDPFLPVSSDYGDWLIPTPGAFSVGSYADDGRCAVAVSRSGNVIVNGQHWDYWMPGTGVGVAERQIQWLLGCPPDLDGDGELTVFDFFEFQNRFGAGGADGFADFDYDGRLDVFDFLEFLNMFEAGC